MSNLLRAQDGGRGNASSAGPADFALTPGHALPAAVIADLRTDHAGEIGAVRFYQGVLRVTRDPALRSFAERHMATEQAHLRQIEAWLPLTDRSRLLPLWHLAGWLTGAVPALLGPRAVYGTIEAVERFVDCHYQEQIERLAAEPSLGQLRQTLQDCQGDEVAHREEAAAAGGGGDSGPVLRVWGWIVGVGSRGAVAICRRL
ncbi:demethoxyubiquinone hydroxylase family protein [Variovorax sp. LG9.2]|uniref:demethoxyubiquinone hydroxylase family protein n=1 Tax=Variovorax sp. LG9.2 TaxID=3048626 RepID=UPI002B22D5B0|nr:demethoxyubiquinone hydroxylase family protein [Variovorax sp. LG9.2]MEB0060249.1 demethoxyubiquinone hydroxylase family protein [Variovorax sp. LG9.2]